MLNFLHLPFITNVTGISSPMKLIRNTKEMCAHMQEVRLLRKEIGFVPTIGALHQGHLSLVKEAQSDTDYLVVSIFVNPTQFNSTSDFTNYPDEIDQDLELLNEQGVDCVFLPNSNDLYANKSPLKFDFGFLEKEMEGKFRPGHFNGVATVVAKFFHVVHPHKSYFGQKDIQQVAVIRALVDALSFQTEVVVVPTLRERSGLAMSSRNQRLTDSEIIIAAEIYKTLTFIKKELVKGRGVLELRQREITRLEQNYGFRVEYLELTKASNLENVSIVGKGEYAICLAAYLGDVRLIDNLVFVSR